MEHLIANGNLLPRIVDLPYTLKQQTANLFNDIIEFLSKLFLLLLFFGGGLINRDHCWEVKQLPQLRCILL